MLFEVDDEVTFRSRKASNAQRLSLKEITNTNTDMNDTAAAPPPKASMDNKRGLAWSDSDEFPPVTEIQTPSMLAASSSPLYTKTSTEKGQHTNASPMGACDSEDDDNDVTVALERFDLAALQDRDTLRAQPSFLVAKYTEKDMALVREEMTQDKSSLDEAMQIADKLMERAVEAETERAVAALELEAAQTALSKERDEAQLQLAPMRALSHTLQALEKDMAKVKESHAAELAAKQAEQEQALRAVQSKREADKAALKEALAASTQKTDILQKELQRQQGEHEVAVGEAKAKVYAKVKAQFEQGNRDYKKVLAQKEARDKALEAAQADAKEAAGKTVAADEKTAALRVKLAKAEKEATEGRAASTAVTVTAEKLKATLADKYATLHTSGTKLITAENKLKALQAQAAEDETILTSATNKLAAAEAFVADLQQQSAAVHSELATAKGDLAAAQKERDVQMLAVAKFATSQTALEAQVEQVCTERDEAEARSAGLRTMNEEMMEMLEKVHGV